MLLGFCSSTSEIWIFVGKLVTIFKIIIPVILVVIGIVSFGKAVIADDDKEIKTAITKLVKKVILAVIIFFIPQLLSAVFRLVWTPTEEQDFTCCIDYVAGKTKCTLK
jgi:fumarate reductase subunit D